MKSYEINFDTIPPDLEPNENITLWRYMSFSSLCEILINDHIPLISVHNLSDKTEGSILRGILSKLPNARPDSIQYAMQIYYESTHISSWHQADNENAAMWDRYTHGGEGIAISTTAKLLLDCIESGDNNIDISRHELFSTTRIDALPPGSITHAHLVIKPIKYTSINPTDFEMETKYLHNGYDKLCFFYKLEDFQDESEMRILLSTHGNPYYFCQLDPSVVLEIHKNMKQSPIAHPESVQLKIDSASKLIQQIIVSPHAHDQFITTVKQSVQSINLYRQRTLQTDPIECDVIESRRKEWTKRMDIRNPNKNQHRIAYANRGAAYVEQGDFHQALADFTKAIALEPNNDEGYYNRGVVYHKQDNWDQAIEDYTKAIELNPDNDQAYNNRGAVYQKQGNLDKAIEDHTRAIELNPDNALAYESRGEAHQLQGNNDLAEADLRTARERAS